MTVIHLGNGVLRGLAADAKPTTYPAGSTFLETDTGNQFYYTGSAWSAIAGGGGGSSTTSWLEPSIYIYKDSVDSTYKAKDNATGSLLGTTSTTDCSLVLQAAITALSAGGEIKYGRGTFDHKTAVTCTTSGIQIKGEGRGTKCTITPSSAVTNFLTFGSCNDCKVRDFWLQGNTNVTNIIHVYTSTPSVGCSRGEISGCLIDGTTKTTGHHGIWMDGTRPSGTSAVYFWRIINNDFLNEDIGIQLTPPDANANFITNNNFAVCNVGIDIDDVDECMLSGNFGQTLPTAVIRLNNNGATGGAQYNTLCNTQGEHATSPIVLFEAGSKFNSVFGVVNTGGPRITDNSGQKNFLEPGLLISNHADVTLTGSPHTYTNVDGYPETVYVTGGIVTDISIKRETITKSVHTDTDKSVRLDAGDQIIITYPVSGSAPTVKVVPAG